MEVNHRTTASIRFSPRNAHRGATRQRITPDTGATEKERGKKREGESHPYDMRTILKKGDADLF